MAQTAQAEEPGLLGRVRKARIIELVHREGFASNTTLAARFGVSEMTVRRDLGELEQLGELTRTHGGAVSSQSRHEQAREPFFDERIQKNHREKLQIATISESLIGKGQAVALDVGTTTYELAMKLMSRTDVRVVTNNLRIATLLDAHAVEIYLVGGRVRHSEMSVCGPVAIQQVRQLWFDTAFIGVSGLSEDGIYDYSIEESDVKRAYLERSTRKVVVCDQTKFGRNSLVKVAGLGDFDTLISDKAPPPAIAAALARAGVTVLFPDD